MRRCTEYRTETGSPTITMLQHNSNFHVPRHALLHRHVPSHSRSLPDATGTRAHAGHFSRPAWRSRALASVASEVPLPVPQSRKTHWGGGGRTVSSRTARTSTQAREPPGRQMTSLSPGCANCRPHLQRFPTPACATRSGDGDAASAPHGTTESVAVGARSGKGFGGDPLSSPPARCGSR